MRSASRRVAISWGNTSVITVRHSYGATTYPLQHRIHKASVPLVNKPRRHQRKPLLLFSLYPGSEYFLG